MEHLEIVLTIAIAFYGISKKQKQQKKKCQKNKENVKSWMQWHTLIWILQRKTLTFQKWYKWLPTMELQMQAKVDSKW